MVKMFLIVTVGETDVNHANLLAKANVLSLSKLGKNDFVLLEKEVDGIDGDQVDVADDTISFEGLIEKYRGYTNVESLYVLSTGDNANDLIETFKPDFIRVLSISRIISPGNFDMDALEKQIAAGTESPTQATELNLSGYTAKLGGTGQVVNGGRRYILNSESYVIKKATER